MSHPRQPHYPFEPLERLLGVRDHQEEASRLGVTRRQLYRFLDEGLTERFADHLAVRLGLHPALIWPEWFGEDVETPPERVRLGATYSGGVTNYSSTPRIGASRPVYR